MKIKIAILNGRKMTLPYYGKYNGMYGYYTSEGFIYAFMDDNEGKINQEIELIGYSDVISCSEEDYQFVYGNLPYEEY